jgi:CheY-like chemotaxis protein
MPDTFYGPLKRSVSILVVDDDPNLLDLYEDLISGHPLYSVITASTARLAEQIIKKGVHIHLSILDFGIDDIGSDEYYLLRKYSKKIPFVIISGSADLERAFEASTLGAAGLIAKPPETASMKFWNTLSRIFLDKTILPDFSITMNPLLKKCCDILRTDLPESVTEWANKAHITDAYLRKLLSESTTFPPKHILFLYKIYKNAFSYYDSLYLSEICDSQKSLPAPDQMDHRRLINYYLQNKRELDAIRDKSL